MSLRVMVTGASGFVGGAFVKACAGRGNEVVAVMRSPCTLDGKIRSVVVGDLANPIIDWREALQGVDVVVHLAARAHVPREEDDDALQVFRRVNTDATLELARQAARVGIKRLVFLSSIGVNGAQTFGGDSLTETTPPAPHSPYARSKYEAELGLFEIGGQTGMEIVVIRPPLVYGPAAPGNFGKLVRAVESGIPLPLGAIHNCRSLIALDNLVDLISTCLAHPAASNQVFVAADGEDVSTTQLLRKVAAACRLPARLIPIPASLLRLAATVLGKRAAIDRLLGSLKVDACKTRDVLGWTPVVSMDEQLKKMAG